MRELERLVGYKSLKAKFSRCRCSPGNMDENFVDEEETEVSFKTVYINPIIERDEKISALISISRLL